MTWDEILRSCRDPAVKSVRAHDFALQLLARGSPLDRSPVDLHASSIKFERLAADTPAVARKFASAFDGVYAPPVWAARLVLF